MKKAQLFSLEAILSIIVFMFVMLFLLSFWNIVSTRLNSAAASGELELQAAQITDILVSSRGFPEAWENDSASVIIPGLMFNPHNLEQQKVDAFVALNYSVIKHAFNIERFDFRFDVRDANGNLLSGVGVYPSTDDEAIVFQRFALINNQTRQVLFTLWH